MKTLVNCTPTEFFAQTNKIRKSAEKWLKDTNISTIRKRLPQGLPEIKKDMSDDEKAEILIKRNEMIQKQIADNFKDILGEILEEHPQETIELMALMCFIEPDEADNHKMSEYLVNFNEMISDEAVLGFFSSLELLGVTNTSDAAQV